MILLINKKKKDHENYEDFIKKKMANEIFRIELVENKKKKLFNINKKKN